MKFKKISAIFASTLMAGLTIAGAAAASFPAPFVQSGVADVAIVYGTGAGVSTLDQTQAGNIQTTLAASMPKTGGSSTEGGESYKFEKTSTKLYLGDNVTKILTTLDDGELETLLADGKYIDNDNDEFDYTQKLEMNTSIISMWNDNDYAEDTPTVGIRIASGLNVLNYTITFSDEPLIDDLVNSDLPFMGKEYYVLSNSTSGDSLILTLLDSAETKILTEGETIDLNVDGTAYTCSIAYIGSSEVKLTVNGQTTSSLAEGNTQKLSDGSYIGIKDIMYVSKDTGVSSVEFSIGKGKLKLTSGSEVQINDEAVSGLTAVMVNSTAALGTSTAKLTSIELEWKADEDLFLTEDTEITMPGFGIVKMAFGGATYPTEEVITVQQGGDSYATLENFPLKDGEADIDFLYGADGGPFSGIGKDANNKLITTNETSITFDKDTDAYFVASYASTTEGESYLMRLSNFVLDGTTNKTDVEYYKDGAWVKKKEGAKNGDTFSMGNAELGIGAIDRVGKSAVVTANASSTNFYHLYSAEGLRTYLPWVETVNNSVTVGAITFGSAGNTSAGHNATSFYLTFSEEDKDGNIGSGDQFNVTVGWDSSSTPEVEVSNLVGSVNAGGDVAALEIGDTDVWRSFMYSALSTEFLWDKPTSGQDSIKIMYHGEEVPYDVYVTSPGVTVSGTSTLGNVLAKDSEVSNFQGKNLIIVGGSCINSAAAKALGVSDHTCGAAFTTATGVGAGQFLIKSVADVYTTGKIALVVAGYDVADTANAATYLRTKTVDTSAGKAYKGTTATTADLIVQ